VSHFAIAAVGADRPGIVAAVTGVLVDHDCNLEDTSMSILRGHFTMMLVVSGPEGLDAAALEQAVAAAAEDLVVSVRPIDDGVPESPGGDEWNLAVYGADRPGIVHRVSRLLADRGVNIVDLTTRIIGSEERPVYAMILDVTLPAGLDPPSLQLELEMVAAELGVDCSLHPSEADIL
jgi:glycine cleavage system transcriptional repressor